MEMETRMRKVRPEINTQVDFPKIPDHVNCRCKPESETMREFMKNIEFTIGRLKFTPIRIIKNGPATVVFWKDGTKTVVKCAPETTPSDYDAFTAALAIKIFGNNSRLKKMIKVLTVVENPNKKKAKEPAETAVQVNEAAVEE